MSQPDSNYHQALTANRKLLEQVAALQAENERLRLEVAGRAAVVDANKTLHQQTDLFRRLYAEEEAKVKSLKSEVERLTLLQVETLNERNKAEAENERLRKAGDAMDIAYLELVRDRLCGNFQRRFMLLSQIKDPVSEAWNAAKGVQS